MGRIRTIKPEFQQSESMGRVSRDARLLFILLWPFVDDSGRARGNSRMLASYLFPYDEDAPDLIDGWLKELEDENCIVRYEVDGTVYIAIRNWLKHQKIDRPTPSKIPDFDEGSRILANPREPSAMDLVPSTVDRGPSTVDLENPPNPPAGGNGVSQTLVEIPRQLDTPAFREAWGEFVEHRKQIRKPLKPLSASKAIKILKEIGHDAAIQSINQSIASGWTGVFPVGSRNGAGTGKPAFSPPDNGGDATRRRIIIHGPDGPYEEE